jgi:predicted RNase H-like nuclease (RuvC/YqgF family)
MKKQSNKEIKEIKATLKARIIPNLPLTPESVREDARTVIDNFEWDYYFKEYNQKIRRMELIIKSHTRSYLNHMQKIKELEKDNFELRTTVAMMTTTLHKMMEEIERLHKFIEEDIEVIKLKNGEINKLKSQLQEQRKKIFEEIENLPEFKRNKIRTNNDRWIAVVQLSMYPKDWNKLKSLLENDLCDKILVSEETGMEYTCSFKRNHKGLHSFEDSRNIEENSKGEKRCR